MSSYGINPKIVPWPLVVRNLPMPTQHVLSMKLWGIDRLSRDYPDFYSIF